MFWAKIPAISWPDLIGDGGLATVAKPGLSLDGDGDISAAAGGVVDGGGQLNVLLLLRGRLVVAGIEDQLDEAEKSAEAIGDCHVEVELDERIGRPAAAVEEVDQRQKEWHVLHTLGPDHFTHDGERGRVHDRAEDDAEDADDHGALLVGVGAEEHADHHAHHEHRLGGEHAEHLQLHGRTHGHG